jgi:adenylate kinase family enzyme
MPNVKFAKLILMVVIAISGASTSGKSTLTEWLWRKYSCVVVQLDRFFRKPMEMPRIHIKDREFSNWETFESLNWEPFLEQLTEAQSNPIVIVEGFILFAHPQVAQLCDVLITLKFDESEMEIARSRRIQRDHHERVPVDYREKPFASRTHFLANYFDQVIWAEMLKHPEYIDPVGWNKPRLVLKATDEKTLIQEQTKAFLDRILNGNGNLI